MTTEETSTGNAAPRARDAARAVRVLVVIVNYRTAALVVDCLRSLEREVADLPGTRVVVIENGSADGSAELLGEAIAREGWGSWARLETVEVNGGFAAGNNVALRRVLAAEDGPEFVHLLNPDTTVRPGAIRELVDFLQVHPDVGIVGSRLEYPDGTRQASCFRFYNVWSELDNGMRLGLVSRLLAKHVSRPPHLDVPHAVDWVSGASLMMRRQVLDAVGPMDERYFLYYEESDFCLRAARAGWSCWHVPASRVVHLIGKSTGVTGDAERERRRPKYWFESRRHYFIKNHGHVYQVLVDVTWLAGFMFWRLRRRIQRKPDMDPPHLGWDFLRYSLLGL